MKFFRKLLIALAVFLLLAAVLVWFLPASWVLPGMQSRWHGLRLAQVHGSIWNGGAGRVTTPDGQLLGALHWRLSRRLLLGQARLHIALHGAVDFQGDVERLDRDRLAWHDVTAYLDLGHLPTTMMPANSRPGGRLAVQVDHALLQGGWPLQMQATAQWRRAMMHADGEAIVLGNLQASAQADGGIIKATLRDTGNGPLQVNLRAALSPLGWRVQGIMHARGGDPALHQWLTQFGRPDADGKVHVRRSAGLAGTLPEAPPQGSTQHDP